MQRRHRKSSAHRQKQSIAPLTAAIKQIQSELKILNLIICRHDQDIGEQGHLLEKHTQRLEQLADQAPISPAISGIDLTNRPTSTTGSVLPSQPNDQSQSNKLDISRFSPQEKRILSVFFQNQDMALSYADIAHYLSKSPNTIKNQVRQINMKTDLFHYTVDNQSRKRYKLKEGLKIEKYLNIHRPDGSPDRLS